MNSFPLILLNQEILFEAHLHPRFIRHSLLPLELNPDSDDETGDGESDQNVLDEETGDDESDQEVLNEETGYCYCQFIVLFVHSELHLLWPVIKEEANKGCYENKICVKFTSPSSVEGNCFVSGVAKGQFN